MLTLLVGCKAWENWDDKVDTWGDNNAIAYMI